jgi:hypothetical protein
MPEGEEMIYRLVERLSPDLIGLTNEDKLRSLWTRGRQRVERGCQNCHRLIRPSDPAWRPANQSAMNRHHRLCVACFP